MADNSSIRAITHRLSLDLHEIEERLEATSGEITLRLTTLRDLNATIDRMFEELEELGRPELLEALCPYFGVVWPSARALAREVASAAPCSFLEMGCGLAIPSLVGALQGFDVLATDFHPQVERFLDLNRAANLPEERGASLRYQEWDWQKAPAIEGRFDWVIGSDLLYDRELPVPLARTMASAVKPGGRITLTDPGRPYLQPFCDELSRLGFRQETRIVSVPHPQKEKPEFRQEIFVLDYRSR